MTTNSGESGATAVPGPTGHDSGVSHEPLRTPQSSISHEPLRTQQSSVSHEPTHLSGTRSHETTSAPVQTVAHAPAPRPVPSPDINVNVPGQRGDQVRWGPVWAGLIVALPTFLLGTLAFLAIGVLDGGDVSGTTTGIVTGLIALGAFFLGGLTASATTMWRDVRTGLLHGILVWALSIVAILFLTLLGGGALLGSAGNIASQLIDPAAATQAATQADESDVPEVSDSDQQEAVDTGQSAASYGLLGLGLTFLASAAGGVVGAKFWPRKRDLDSTTTPASTH